MNRSALLTSFLLLAAAVSRQEAYSLVPISQPLFPQSLSSQAISTQLGAPAQASLQGSVVKDPGSEPLKKALIELIAESPSDGGNHTALTGPDGSFHIENISPGRYRLFVERTGFQVIDNHRGRSVGRVLTLVAGQELKDVAIRLQAAAIVEGRVSDEDGDPMAGAQVAVMRQTFVSGRKRWEQAGADRTNDLGEYRISGLAAGNYFISVTPPPDFRSLIETSSATSSGSRAPAADLPARTSYQTTYYPGTRDRGQAEAIQLHGGDDFPANFALTPGPSLTIRGSVTNLPPGATAAITLQSEDFSLMLNGAEVHKDGTFEIRDVSPGSYSILASVENAAAPMMARQAVQITSANVEGLRLAPQAGGTIRGRIRMEAGSNGRPDPSQVFLMLRSAEGNYDVSGAPASEDGFFTLAHVNGEGSFEWKGVPAGRYSVEISDESAMPDWFLKSIASGGRDAMDSGFIVGGGTTSLDLLANGNGGLIDGVVSNEKDESVADAVVVAVPESPMRNRPDRYRKAVSDQSGRFILRGLPPGEYTLLAWDGVEGEAYYNAEFLKNFELQGKKISVKEGDHVSVKVKSIPTAQEE